MAYYEVVLNGLISDQPMLSVLHYEIVGVPDFQQFADAIALLMIPDLTDHVVPEASWDGITVREDVPGAVGVTFNFTGGPVAGTNVDNEFYGLIAVNMRKFAQNGSKPAQGRIFQGGIPASATTSGGNIGGPYLINLNAFWAQMISIDFAGLTADMVIKATNPGAPNTVPYNPVDVIQGAGRPAKQSRRNFNT